MYGSRSGARYPNPYLLAFRKARQNGVGPIPIWLTIPRLLDYDTEQSRHAYRVILKWLMLVDRAS